ncbi:immunoglobulin superfamily member 3-like [Aplochiton taeniatus]
MSFSHLLLRGTFLLFWGIQLHIQLGEASVLTQVQAGPLYRVVGYPLTISCNVSGFSNPDTKQDFEFLAFKPQNPDRELNVISTRDPNFSFAMYYTRVKSEAITLEHQSATSILFQMKSLEETDEGEYECCVLNSESVYIGTYSAKTSVQVLENTLIVDSPHVHTSLTHDEGDTLTLSCKASSNTFQHTHLSVTWYLHGRGEALPRPIISLDRDLTLNPGPGFQVRYQAGLVGLEKVGEALYRLKMAELEVSDTGRIYCQAQEWIQDPDRSWFSIATSAADATTLEVKAKEVAPDVGSLVVRVSVQQATLQEGQQLSVSCSVEAQSLAASFFSVAWLRDGQELARIGPTGVLSVGSEDGGRERSGELRAARTGDREHRLTLKPVRTQDQGEYQCRAWPLERGEDGSFTQGASQDSSPQQVTISAIESGLSVAMEQQNVSVNEGGRLQLTCGVNGAKGPLSVAWQHRSLTAAGTGLFGDVLTLSRDGVMAIGGEYSQRSVRGLRSSADTFLLELGEVTTSDAGVYQCTVSEWTTGMAGSTEKSHSQSQKADVMVHSVESLLKVDLKSRDPQLTVGEGTDLVCRIRGPRLPVTVTWTLQRGESSGPENILTLSPSGDVIWRGDQGRYQLKTSTTPHEVRHILRILQASPREAGRYQCELSMIVEKVHRKLPASYPLAVLVNQPESKLSVVSSPSPVEQHVNTDMEMKCSVSQATSDTSHFAVTWLVQKEGEEGNQTVLSSDRDAVVTLGAWAQSGGGERISMQRMKGNTFELTIRQARIGDSGSYLCVVEEWLQGPHGQWHQLPASTKTIERRVLETVKDLRVDQTKQQLKVTEGEDVELNCSLTSGASDPSVLYALTWFYMDSVPSSSKVPLVVLGHRGTLSYPENQGLQDLQGRICFSRPSRSSFRLALQGARQGDGGSYQCQVDQYRLNDQGTWEQKASEESGITNLTVMVTVSKLSVVSSPSPVEQHINTDMEMKCSVSQATSDTSRFAVTWLVQKEGEEGNQTVLSSDRDAVVTLGAWAQSGGGERISMQRMKGNTFELTIRKARIGDSGSYLCVVEEWLQGPHGQWHQLPASTKTIERRVLETGGVSDPTCSSAIGLWILVPILCVLLATILFLSMKLHLQASTTGKNTGNSLWAEEHPMNPKPNPED